MFYKVIVSEGLDAHLVNKIVSQTVYFANIVLSFLYHGLRLEEAMRYTNLDLIILFYNGDEDLYPISQGKIPDIGPHKKTLYNLCQEQLISINLSSAISFLGADDDMDIDNTIDSIAITIAHLIVNLLNPNNMFDIDDYILASDDDY